MGVGDGAAGLRVLSTFSLIRILVSCDIWGWGGAWLDEERPVGCE